MNPSLLFLLVLVAEVVEQTGQPRAVETGGRSVGSVPLVQFISNELGLLPPKSDPEVLQVGSADEGLHPAEVAACQELHDHDLVELGNSLLSF